MVMAWVDVKTGSEIIAPTGSEQRWSRTVGAHVAERHDETDEAFAVPA
jgi:hypothetical protein